MANPKASTAKGKGKVAAAAVEPGTIVVGSWAIFNGYPEGTDPAEMILEEGVAYEVVDLPGTAEVDGETVETGYVLRLANPEFNSKKKEHPDTNPAYLETEVFEEEITLDEGEPDDTVVATVPATKGKTTAAATKAAAAAEEGNDEGNEEEGDDAPIDLPYLRSLTKEELIELATAEKVKMTPAQKKTAEALVAHLAKTWELEEVEDEQAEPETPAPTPAPRGKAKAAAAAVVEKAPAATGKGKAAKAPAEKPPVTKAPVVAPLDPDEVPDLDEALEDAGVLAMIEGDVDLISVAQGLESEVASNEYRLGGILYHIKKNKLHLAVDKKGKLIEPEYGEPGGFKKFLMDNFNLDYRKATYLIDIYVNFTLAGIENAAEVVGNIGWTKASKIAKPLGLEGADVDGLLDAAEKNTVADLSTIVKEQFTVGGTPGTPGTPGTTVSRTTLKFRYVEEEAAVLEDALKAIADQFGLSPEAALYQVVTDAHATMLAGGEEQEEPEVQTTPAKRGGRATARA